MLEILRKSVSLSSCILCNALILAPKFWACPWCYRNYVFPCEGCDDAFTAHGAAPFFKCLYDATPFHPMSPAARALTYMITTGEITMHPEEKYLAYFDV